MSLSQKSDSNLAMRLAYAGITIAAVALLLVLIDMFWLRNSPGSNGSPRGNDFTALSSLERIKKSGEIRVGYGGFPPYTIVDLGVTDSNKRVTGFVVDMVEEIARRAEPPLQVKWHRLNWETFRADMASDRFDFLADAVYQTVPNALDFGLTIPFGYFGIAAAVVLIDDDRFNDFHDLNRSDIKIALAQGYVSTNYAKAELTEPEFKIVPVGADAFVQMDEVLAGRADVALNDIPTVVQYVRAHPNKVKALWVDHPPSSVAAGFVTNRDDRDLLEFLNTAIRILQADGTLSRLDEKWQSLGHFDHPDLVPGAGLNRDEKN